ncbi:hypothetical protein Fmac_025199 [Flemingia macrophylla]|uniref:Protein kinase domain-containing protein n=1 Tax=Flemingia macrophylla TaxID=520843 RepID=A0ABD1LRJ1_9FABA
MGSPTWRQVSVSNALLTNKILVMRRIVENVSPHPNVIELYDDRYSEIKVAGVVSGLEAIYRANIVHRDLKPENCLFLDVRRDSPLKIMDFGLSYVEEFTDLVVGSFYEKTWKGITHSAKQLISDLLTVDPSRRPSAKDAFYTLTNLINLN